MARQWILEVILPGHLTDDEFDVIADDIFTAAAQTVDESLIDMNAELRE